MIRAFLGLEVPEAVASTLEGATLGLRIGRLVPRENFHLTMAFLGEHPEPVIEDVHHALDGLRAHAVDVDITGLGMFGGARPRSLFADVAPSAALTALRRKVRQAARGAGVELSAERFHPHITLARFGSGLTGEEATAAEAFVVRNSRRAEAAYTAPALCLFRSYLGRSGPIYEVLADYPLMAGPEAFSAG